MSLFPELQPQPALNLSSLSQPVQQLSQNTAENIQNHMCIQQQSLQADIIKKQKPELQQLKQALISKIHQLSSNSHKYQYLALLFLCIQGTLTTMVITIGPFAFMNPIFMCPSSTNAIHADNPFRGQLKPTPEIQACQIISSCQIENSWTASFYTGLYCQYEYLRSVVQGSIFFGVVLGMFLFVPISDIKGRKFISVVAYLFLIVGLVLIIVGIYGAGASNQEDQTATWNFWIIIIIIGLVLCGFFYAVNQIVAYVYISEFCEDKLSQKALIIFCSAWGVGEMLFLPIYYFIPQWYNFMIILLLIPSIGLFIISLFFLIETPIFLFFIQKNKQSFLRSITQVSIYNNSPPIVPQIKCLCQKYLKQLAISQAATKYHKPIPNKNSMMRSLKKLFTTKKYLVPCLSISLIGVGFNFYYFGMQGSMERTGYNFGISMFLAGLQQAVGYAVITLFVHKMLRKKWLLIFVLISCIIGFLFLIPAVNDSPFLQSLFAFLARICTILSYSLYALITTELFPNQILSTAMGVVEGLCQLIIIFIPFTIVKMNDVGIHQLVFGSVFWLVTLVGFFGFKETLGAKYGVQNQQCLQQNEEKAEKAEKGRNSAEQKIESGDQIKSKSNNLFRSLLDSEVSQNA